MTFNWREPSLLKRMLIGQMLAVIAFSAIAMANLVWRFQASGDGAFDQHLTMLGSIVERVIEEPPKDANFATSLALFDRFIRELTLEAKTGSHAVNESNNVALRITGESGKLIYQSGEVMPQVPVGVTSGYFDQHTPGGNWRGLRKQTKSGYWIEVAQTTDMLANSTHATIIEFIVMPLAVFLPIALIVLCGTTARGLTPLRSLAEGIAHRSPNDLTPIEHQTPYAETKPLVSELNLLLGKLESTLSRERNFLADAAHELRTPLAVVQAQAHVLETASNEEEKRVAAAELRAGVERAASLIQKLLLTARYSGEDFVPKFETVDLTAFAQERLAAMSALASAKSIELGLDSPGKCFVKLDRQSFVSAIDNVLDNAIRYSPEGSEVRVEISRKDDYNVRLRIEDNGNGIPEELYERVFERFYRVSGTEQQGSGLGLAIVKRVLSLHGGDISLSRGIADRGLAVNLTIPVV